VLGEIGGNEYNFWFGARKPREQAYQFIPDVVGCIASYAQVHGLHITAVRHRQRFMNSNQSAFIFSGAD
jgi:hypothetical protein